jgi:SH3 domain protein
MINQLGEEAEIEVKAPDYKIEDVKPTTYYATQNCNVRSGPSTNYDVVAKLKTNQQVTVIGKVKADNGKSWCIIKTNDKKNPIQMVSGSLLSTKKIEIPKKPSNKSASASSGRHKNSGTTAYQQNQDGLEYDEHEENDCKFANGMRYCTFTSGPEMEAGGVCVECDVCYMQAE